MYQICDACGAVDYIEYDEELEEYVCAVCGAHVVIECFVEELDE
jgi:hypothetical protein